ncbi:MAG TPA: hypothetical protein VFB32_15485 [Rudaea sp.]|nr:hypothetical protein [Rudaea sp.]
MQRVRFAAIATIVSLSFAAGAFMGCATSTRAGQPHMQAALDALSTAEHELGAADEDKGGHRVAALRHVRAAIEETQRGIEYARNH